MTAGAALARLGAEAVHLRPRLRGRPRASRNADRGPAGALRRLRAGEFRHDVPGHGDGAPRAANVAQRAGGRAARQRRREPPDRARLAQAGAPLVLPKGEAPGLAMALGGVGIKLSDLTMLYAGLARGGNAVPLIERIDDAQPAAPRRLLDPVAAWYVGNVLIGTPPPENAAGGRIAYKTGTSYGYRDAWSVGFDGRRTIGVWVGRPDGAPVPGPDRPRCRGADPVRRLRAHRPAPAPLPQRAARRGVRNERANCRRRCSASGPNGAARATAPSRRCASLFPPNGARVELATSDGKPDPLALKIAGGVEPSDRAGQRRAGRSAGRPPHAVRRSRRAGLPAPDRDGRQGRGRQRDGAAAIERVFHSAHAVVVTFEPSFGWRGVQC